MAARHLAGVRKAARRTPWVAGLVATGAALGLLLVARSATAAPLSPGWAPPPGGGAPPDPERDIEALARMLASEDSRPRVQLVLGWLTIEQAKRWRLSVARLLTGRSGLYGPQVLGGEVRYASTRKPATPETRDLARGLLAGAIRPSRALQERGPGPWVERYVGGYTSKRVLERQVHQTTTAKHKAGDRDYGGVWGRLEGTEWFLYSAAAPLQPIPATEEEAAEVLAALPVIPARDDEERVA